MDDGMRSMQNKVKSRVRQRSRCDSNCSGSQMNQIFFNKNDSNAQLELRASYTNTSTWKSQDTKDRDEYARIRQRVKHFAPEQFKDKAKPSNQPCDIFPRTLVDWKQHKLDLLQMISTQKLREAKAMVDRAEATRKIPKLHRTIKSVFGKQGKLYKDAHSPVLYQVTIWSEEYFAANLVQASWPSSVEFQWNGDCREIVLAKTRCGRYLPPPRVPIISAEFSEEPTFLKPLPFDQTGPIFEFGPRPQEIQSSNADMDADATFEACAVELLGTDLMEEIGPWKPAFVPDWLANRQPSTRDMNFLEWIPGQEWIGFWSEG